MRNNNLLMVLAFLAAVVGTGVALQCYVCNSHEDDGCKELDENLPDKYLKDCNDLPNGHMFTLCRKLDMYLDMDFGPHHPKENRIHRACGYEESEDGEDCYYKSGYNTRTWVCTCKEDGCNPASAPAAPAALALLLLVAALRGLY